ncbi:hypothetical protein SBA1_1940001 [Candidatus Sulfotelmatobacter kueseliae]|uniref:Uncharacterized protein n=1 Tax=Candidatus Sulfotelmatobacter kueseliae TaxID=2042962 RepID=A0A2U3KF58_9BACT|nr:hypothetical protein SBA1_1940001 [Candidatus Sulfotelmatobacter kueseliae]
MMKKYAEGVGGDIDAYSYSMSLGEAGWRPTFGIIVETIESSVMLEVESNVQHIWRKLL